MNSGELLRFLDARCAGLDRAHTFTLRAGDIRVMQLSSAREKDDMLDCALGNTECEAGSIEVVQGERRQHKAALIGKLAERRRKDGPIPLIWRPVSASRPGRVAWVAANGGLISNLRIWENVTLPLWYHAARDAVATEQRIKHWLSLLGLAEQEYAGFMVAQPHAVEPWQRKLAGLLRALLQMSPVLVVDAALFEDVGTRLAGCWAQALESCVTEGRAVLVISDKPTTLCWEMTE